mmetsp:Transcript_2102/g.3813  ORF Transcript_2102/g.3813 Transcript_2102/m.3813 type:complete len:128 (+) Transcript_2102:26-409(+)
MKLLLLVLFAQNLVESRSFSTNILSPRVRAQPQPISCREGVIRCSQETPIDSARNKIQNALNAQDLSVTATYDDPNGSHITIRVVSDLFEGVSRVKRQQMVYKAIWDEMQGPVHAVDEMVCKAPSEV